MPKRKLAVLSTKTRHIPILILTRRPGETAEAFARRVLEVVKVELPLPTKAGRA